MQNGNVEAATWRKASFCTAGECVEVARRGGQILMRSSTDPHGGVLAYSVEEFRAFVLGVQAGEFDDLCAPSHDLA